MPAFAVLVDNDLPAPEIPGVRLTLIGTRRRTHGRLSAYEDAVALSRDLDFIRPRIFHSLTLSLPGRAVCHTVATLHDLIPWAYGGLAYLGERVRFGLARRLLRQTELVLAVSESSANDAARVARLQRSRIKVISEGVNPVFAPRPAAAEFVAQRWGFSDPFLLHVGALDPRKDPAALSHALGVVRQSRPEVALILAGKTGPHDNGRLDGRRLGYVTEEELAHLMAAAACLVFPSRYEGFGLPLLEAMACGCPVVAYSNSSIPEVVGSAGLLVGDGDRAGLAAAVLSVVTDGRLAKQLRERGLRRSQRFSWGNTARRTIAAYRRLLA